MNRIYLSKENDPYYNVAAEYELLHRASDATDLFLWQNKPSVIFGRNQNAFAEIDIDTLNKNNISPVRRFSGGGAVFQDLGNVNFTFITKENNAEPEKYLLVLKKALNYFNIDFEFSGRNDLLCNGKKFSGHAYYSNDEKYIYHGTIMVDVDLNMLENILKPSYLKLNSKGINSVRSRVINLTELNKNITRENIKESLMRAFIEVFGKTDSIINIDKESFVAQKEQIINKDEWIYGESPKFSITLERKMECGNVSIYANVADGLISDIKIQSDTLIIIDLTKCEESLKGKLFQEESIFNYINKYILGHSTND